MQAAESLKKTLEAEAEQARPAEVVEYEGIFGPHTTLRYTPTFGGFKEDIILSQYTGVNTFTFRIKTGGLMLAEDEGSYALVDPLTGEKTASISDLYIYDSRVWDAEEEETAEAPEGEPSVEAEEPPLPTYQHHYSVETVIPDQEYLITVVVDEAYLSSEDRVYPVIVDPSFDFNRGSTAINDAVLYSSASARNQKHGSNWDHYIGYYNSTYGVGRLLVKFPGLTNSRVFQSLDKSQITGATFYAWQYRDTSVTTSVRAYLYNGTAWDEQDIRCTTASWNGYASVDGMNGISVTGRAWYGFNIKPAVLKWKDGTHDPAKGLMIRNANESNSSCFKVFNSREWGSSQNSSQMPYVTLSWNAPTPSGISNNGVYYFQNVCSGKYLDIQNNGTANNTPTIQSSLTHNASQRFKLVRDSSGYYRIHAQNTTAKRVLLLNTSNQVVLSDDCSSERALWRIKDEGSGRYSFINKANEGTYAYAMSNMGSGSSGAQIKGQSYSTETKFMWKVSTLSAQLYYNNTVVSQTRLNLEQNRTLSVVTPFAVTAADIQWSVEDPDLVTLTPSTNKQTAVIRGIGVGITTVKVTVWDSITVSCKVTVGTAEEHAEQVFIYRDLIQQYRVFIDSPWKLIDALDLPDIEAANAHALELKHSVQMLQYALLRNEVILNNPGVAAVIAQHILQGQELSVAYDMVINSDLCDSSTAYKNINDEKLQEILLEFLQDAVYFAAMLPFPWISIPARVTIGFQGVIGKDFTGRQMAWWERALDITSGALSVIEGVGFISSAIKNANNAKILDKFDDIARISGDHIASELALALRNGRICGRIVDELIDGVMIDKVIDLRRPLNSTLKGGGNVAVADVSISGLKQWWSAHSKIDVIGDIKPAGAAPGISLKPTNPVFDAFIVGEHLRDVDTEYKILSDIAKALGDNTSATGTIKLFSEFYPCDSCTYVIAQFSNKYKNIVVEVIYNGSRLKP